jgi:hypothetical protein
LARRKLFQKLKIKQITVVGSCWEAEPNALALFRSVLGLVLALGPTAKPDPIAFGREGNTLNS